MFGARKRGLMRQKLEIIRFFSLFYFYLDPNVYLKQQQNSIFLSIRESLRREKFYFGRFAKVYAPKVLHHHNEVYYKNLISVSLTTPLNFVFHFIWIMLYIY